MTVFGGRAGAGGGLAARTLVVVGCLGVADGTLVGWSRPDFTPEPATRVVI